MSQSDMLKYPPEASAMNFSFDKLLGYLRKVTDKLRGKPDLKRAVVVQVTPPTITVRYPRPDAPDMPNVTCIGWGTITMPNIGDYVWVLHPEGGYPIAIGGTGVMSL